MKKWGHDEKYLQMKSKIVIFAYQSHQYGEFTAHDTPTTDKGQELQAPWFASLRTSCPSSFILVLSSGR